MEKKIDKATGTFKRISHNDVRLQSPNDRINNYYDSGKSFQFNHNKSPKIYLQSIKQLIRQADVYMEEGDLEKGYIFYVRSMTLFVEKLPNHPNYNIIDPKEKHQVKNRLNEIFPKIEAIKKKLLEQYERERKECNRELLEQKRIEEEILKQEERQRLKEEEEQRAEEIKRMIASASNVNYFGVAAGARTLVDENGSKVQVVPSKPFINPHFVEQRQPSKPRQVPFVDRSTKPSSLTSSDKLRDIIIPSELMDKFLKLAFSNTNNNIETCGILAGRLERNKLLITHFLIPKQTGSPDSCLTHNEEEIFDFQDQHNLISLGWIHTHPTQTAFLSSVDLHTHCAYQLMMAEAIAIVCAPKYQETGFFHLTPEYGLNYIANCKESGFHPHPTEPSLFTTAKHFKLDYRSIEAVDLRRK